MLKNLIKHNFHISIVNLLRFIRSQYNIRVKLKKAYLNDFDRYVRYSEIKSADTNQKLIGKIIRRYHVIEKGLTMPETRIGFGEKAIAELCKDCIDYYNKKYDLDDEQYLHAISVIFEYEEFHKNFSYKLKNEIIQYIQKIKEISKIQIGSSQYKTTYDEYFKFSNSPFMEFSQSRYSVRNYTDLDVPVNLIYDSLEIARKTPSACNRQGWRTYVFTNQKQILEILDVQGGNRGFGHLTNKLIVICAEIGVFTGIGERNQAFIDGGMFAMNLLYSLHFHKIATCILNCSNSIEKDLKLRALCNIKESEVFIAMISCGIPPQKFNLTISKRYEIKKTNKVFNNENWNSYIS